MLAAFLEAALRSFVLALAVWIGLRVFRIHNVNSQRRAWTAVLIGSLLMPLALTSAAHWHGLSIATIPAPPAVSHLRSAFAPALQPAVGVAPSTSSATSAASNDFVPAPRHAIATAANAAAKINLTSNRVGSPSAGNAPATSAPPQAPNQGVTIPLMNIGMLAYFVISAALLVRLFLGLVSALRLWFSSVPITLDGEEFGGDLNLRWSSKISTPVTIGSGIVLPADYTSWTEEKLRIVLAHERTHVNQRDFYLQLLASLYSALAWFSPLGWWLKRKLSDLGEAISDCSGLNAASNRSAYAQVLLEFAAAPRPTLIGVAMARPSSISRRIEHLLNDSYLRHAFTGGRARVAVLVAPVVLFATAALVRVQAATQPASTTSFQTSTMTSSHAARAAATSPAAPSAPSSPAMQEIATATPPAPPSPTAPVENATAQSEASFDRDLNFGGQLNLSVATGAGNIHLTRGSAGRLHVHGVVKSNEPGNDAEVQQIATNPPIEQNGNVVRIGGHQEGHQENHHNISIEYEIEAPADTVLNAASGSGNITDEGVGQDAKLNTGSGNITATGIEGGFKIQTGSGNIAIDGSGQGDAKAQTGSGNIELKGVNGGLIAQTGSGAIKAAGKPASAWKLQTGSGSIELSTDSAPMNLDASVGSGTISTDQAMAMRTSEDHHHVTGQLNGGGPEVRVETGSGDIRIH